MNKTEWMKSFYQATGLLPERLWRQLYTLSDADRLLTEEVRLRAGRPLGAMIDGSFRRFFFSNKEPVLVTKEDIEELLARATKSSVHAYADQLKNGFITVAGGHRLGICGEAVTDREVLTIKGFSSVNLRIAKPCDEIGQPVLKGLFPSGGFESTLIISRPGIGKTTLLRDMIRNLSYSYMVSVADERMEIAAALDGVPQLDIGESDVLSRMKKVHAIEMLARAMSPQIIALDEITGREDVKALESASYIGCHFLATAHGERLEDLWMRPVYQTLMELKVFKKVVLIEKNKGQRRYLALEQRSDSDAQADWRNYDCRSLFCHGNLNAPIA